MAFKNATFPKAKKMKGYQSQIIPAKRWGDTPSIAALLI